MTVFENNLLFYITKKNKKTCWTTKKQRIIFYS